MNFIDCIKKAQETRRPFKLPEGRYLYIDIDGFFRYLDNDKRLFVNASFFDRDDWELKEEWYEGNFRKKYPNGVLCKVWNDRVYPNPTEDNKRLAIVIDYIDGWFHTKKCMFLKAEPISPDKAPAIIDEED